MIKDCKHQEGSEPTLLALSLVDSITEDRTHVLLRRSTDELHCAGTRMLAEEMGRGAPQLHLANGQKHAWVYGSCVSAIEAVSFRKSQRLAQAFAKSGAQPSRELTQLANSWKERDLFKWMKLPFEPVRVVLPLYSTSAETEDKVNLGLILEICFILLGNCHMVM